jgi:tetratricopeptide (TPR) repeat protein
VNSLSLLHRFIARTHTLDELRTLCMDLGANYDELAGETLSAKARELILWVGRQELPQQKFKELLALLREGRRVPFDQAGFKDDLSFAEALYEGMPDFESELAPRSLWQLLRSRPLVFYPVLALVALVILAVLVSSLVSTLSGVSGARQGLQSIGLISTSTLTPSPAPTLTLTPTPIPTRTPIPMEFDAASEGEVLVVVATFNEARGVVGSAVEDEIARGIRTAARKAGFGALRVGVEPTVLQAEDRAGAEKLGKRYDATLVIWGEVSGVRVTVNYLNLKQPDFDAARATIEETQRTQLADPGAYSSFIVHDLPGHMAFLSLFPVGKSYFAEGNYAASMPLIREAVAGVDAGQPVEGLAEAYMLLGWLYLNFDFGEAEQAFYAILAYGRALELQPNLVDAYYNRAFALQLTGDWVGAKDDYDTVIELDPSYMAAYYDRGLMLQITHDLTGAIADFEQALKLDPDYAAAHYQPGYSSNWMQALNSLCWDYSLLEQPDRALPYCEQLTELAPSDDLPHYRGGRGFTYALLGRYDEAAADLEVYVDWMGTEVVSLFADRGREWIAALKRGENPFTPEVLAELREE